MVCRRRCLREIQDDAPEQFAMVVRIPEMRVADADIRTVAQADIFARLYLISDGVLRQFTPTNGSG